MLLAEDSAVVAEPDERDGALAPQVAEPHVVGLVIGKHDVGEPIGA
jgi:hypothetical protein